MRANTQKVERLNYRVSMAELSIYLLLHIHPGKWHKRHTYRLKRIKNTSIELRGGPKVQRRQNLCKSTVLNAYHTRQFCDTNVRLTKKAQI